MKPNPVASPKRPLLVPPVIVWLLLVDLAIAVALVATQLSVAPGAAALPGALMTDRVAWVVISTVQVAAALWLVGDREPLRLATGVVAGLAIGLVAAWSLPDPPGVVAAALSRSGLSTGFLWYALDTGAAPTVSLMLAGVLGVGLALFLSRHDGFDADDMAVEGVLSQPARYSPAASASAKVTLILGVAVLLVATNLSLAWASLTQGGVVTAGSAPWMLVLGDTAIGLAVALALAVAGAGSLALAGIHRIGRGSPGDDAGET